MEETYIESSLPITVKQLKDFIKDWPEVDDNGDPYQVWIGDAVDLSTPAYSIYKLNQYDIVLSVWGENE